MCCCNIMGWRCSTGGLGVKEAPPVLITVKFQLRCFWLSRGASYRTFGGTSCHMKRFGFVRQMFGGGTTLLMF